MAMNNVKFLSDVEVPNLVVSGGLEVGGTMLSGIVAPGISENSIKQIGDNVAGLKGFYWSEIADPSPITVDGVTYPNARVITLSTVNGEYGTEQDFDISEFWSVDDNISVDSNNHYRNCSKIIAINDKNTITVNFVTFDIIKQYTHPSDSAVFVLAKPDKGLVDFGKYAVAFGDNCKAIGWGNITAGIDNEAIDQYGAVFGNTNKVGYASGAFGKENEALGDASFVAGGKSKANGKLAIALGRHLNVEGEYNFSANSANKVYGRANAALNGSDDEYPSDSTEDGNKVDGMCNLAIGHNNTATENAKYAFVGGNESFVSNEAASALGYKCQALGKVSHAGGSNCVAEANGSFAYGEGLVTKERDQAVFGKFNKPTTSALLVVGVGKDANNPANSLEVYESGIRTPYVVVTGNSIKVGNTTITEANFKTMLSIINNDLSGKEY